MEIRGELVVLREKRLEDAADDYAWRCDPELAAYDAVPPLQLAFASFLESYRFELDYPVPRQRNFAIEDLSGKHIGNCMYYDIDTHRAEAELGIMIGDRDYWSKGYGTDAVLTLLRHIFETTTLRRIYLNTLDWNHRAQRSFLKCGFVPIREHTRGGYRFITMEIYRDRLEQAPAQAQESHGGSASPRGETREE